MQRHIPAFLRACSLHATDLLSCGVGAQPRRTVSVCLHAETSGHEGLTQVQKAKKGKPLTFWYGQSEITAL